IRDGHAGKRLAHQSVPSMNARVITIYGATLRHCRALSEILLSLENSPAQDGRMRTVTSTLFQAWG
ncbi:hypothetical protein, partial [Cutibacterium granulosum]|uniref:hypothetical protein n=1 Tax=Cutibacterium granulosum TaxID=33011 RepID=UPI002B23D554